MQRIYTRLTLSLLVILFFSGCSSMGDAMRASPSFANSFGMADIPLYDLKERYTNEYSKWINVNGLDIHYQETGEGPTIVLLHGEMSSLQTWDDWALELSKSYRVISVDLPGFGLTGAPEDLDDYSEEYILNTFAKFVDTIDLTDLSIVGNALGGYVAAHYAATYPDRINHLILINPIAYPQTIPWIMSLSTTPVVSSIGGYFQPPTLITMNVKQVYGDHRRIQRKHMDRYVHMAQRPGARKAYIKTMKILKERSTQEVPMPFNRIKAPTLIMWGEADGWIPLDLAQRWNDDIRDSELVLYPGVGHMPMEEVPEQTVKDAILFLNGQEIVPPAPIEKPFSEPGALERTMEGISPK